MYGTQLGVIRKCTSTPRRGEANGDDLSDNKVSIGVVSRVGDGGEMSFYVNLSSNNTAETVVVFDGTYLRVYGVTMYMIKVNI